ncbi:MAG TPA: hypothetical protein VL688_03920, partial [Verrucomicrobiae bacterium]|nr:hypothetical protein [Verrucomicrobiae bacterium]
MKKIALTVLVLSFAFLSSSKAFAGGAYGIDSIIDNNTGDNWLDSTPTLQRGSTYNVTVHGGFAGLLTYPEDPAELGLYADFDGTRSPSQWSTFLGAPVIQGTDSPDVLAFGPLVFAEYGLTGNFLVPNDAAAVGSFFAYIRPGSAGAT